MTESRFSFESVRFYFLCYKFHLPQNAVYEITDQRCTDQFEQKRNDGEHDFKSKPDHAVGRRIVAHAPRTFPPNFSSSPTIPNKIPIPQSRPKQVASMTNVTNIVIPPCLFLYVFHLLWMFPYLSYKPYCSTFFQQNNGEDVEEFLKFFFTPIE